MKHRKVFAGVCAMALWLAGCSGNSSAAAESQNPVVIAPGSSAEGSVGSELPPVINDAGMVNVVASGDFAGSWKADGYVAEGSDAGDGWYSFVITREADGAAWRFEGMNDNGVIRYEGTCQVGEGEEIPCGGELSQIQGGLNWYDSMLEDGVVLKRAQ